MANIYSNIVPENVVRKKQQDTLKLISDSLVKSFGPMGSHTAIIKNLDQNGVNIEVKYTKDGHTIINNIVFKDSIERSVQDLLTELTRYIVKEVGDGTTSAILLCNEIFNALCNNEEINKESPADIIKHFSKIIKEINTRIESMARECTIEDIYNIALISTNNNEDLSMTIKNIYEHYGMEAYIDLGISNEIDNIVKEYDGMTLETGFADNSFINNPSNNTSSINSPKIYAFADPIDTPEMLGFMDKILYDNILRCFEQGSVYEPVPTVILCKKISPDTSSYFRTIINLMNKYPGEIPLLIVSDIHQEELYDDITMMCGAPMIRKYLNPDLQQQDIDKGLAPTVETIINFCGSCEAVISDQLKTKFIRPSKMFNEDGSYSDDYNAMVRYLETQIEKCENESASIDTIYRLKRRYYSFKSSMIDLLIGGVTTADRENLKASADDAISNCRSAAKYGVGYGSNFMALDVISKMLDEPEYKNDPIVNVLNDSYIKLSVILYNSLYNDENKAMACVCDSIANGCPLNLRTREFDKKVLTSIKSDITILDTINNILTLMFTCNQYLVQAPYNNIYITEVEEDN